MEDREPTDPEHFALLVDELIENERAEVDLAPYMGSVGKLRDAGKSYRFIAGMLNDHGIECDHNSLWRAYNKWAGSDDPEAQIDAHESEQTAEQDHHAAQEGAQSP
jgi:hypothetical protein